MSSEFMVRNKNKQKQLIPLEKLSVVCHEMGVRDVVDGCKTTSEGVMVEENTLNELANEGLQEAEELKDFIESLDDFELNGYFVPFENIDYNTMFNKLKEKEKRYSKLRPDDKMDFIASMCSAMKDFNYSNPVCHMDDDIIWIFADDLDYLADRQFSEDARLFRNIAKFVDNPSNAQSRFDNSYYYIERPSHKKLDDYFTSAFVLTGV